ncbi:PREDICTED: C-type lectin domain family 5 member A-like isoform X2 [Haliaeetus leucocephalus]|uniref:C-type lectin domain family 5 member A-like isoform X2 n=1 Tax=Haliaeetus leucocephalus TaxID=52644 RepID=UPI000522D6E9|nr:PREDICTED: C-type lectin domain family 5 member A-like isoform X2 [Haliaeetus albicilla]XP_010573648.1 PREDICTED: C-type lectin domain family 5 member A-like isoform X2 [Haliaeetus leucocephalus]
MSENLIYADLNLTDSTRPRLQKVTDIPDTTYAELKVQSLDTNAADSYTLSGKSCCSRTRVAVLVAVIILLLVLVVCLILMCCPQDWKQNGEKCYFFSPVQKTLDWNTSRKECIDKNSDLVIIDSKEELGYLFSQTRSYYYLLGLIFSKREKKWKWINNVEHNPDMFTIGGDFTDYFCTVIGHDKVETASCKGALTTQNMCEKAANILERQKES